MRNLIVQIFGHFMRIQKRNCRNLSASRNIVFYGLYRRNKFLLFCHNFNTPMSQATFERSTRISRLRNLRRYKSHASAIAPRSSSYPSCRSYFLQPHLIPGKKTITTQKAGSHDSKSWILVFTVKQTAIV